MSATVLHGDCLAILPTLEAESFHAVVTDPPYFIDFMSRRWDNADAPPVDADFANWLAGFIDGEGCFSVHKKNVNGCETYDCQFSITLRADDKPIILEIRKRLGGIGSVAERTPNGEDRPNSKPQVRYCVSSQADCQILRAILSAFPLRAKKARDFEAWSHALDCWLVHEPSGSWCDMAYFRDACMAVKRYGSTFSPQQLFHYRWASQVLRVLKPGGHMVAFGGSRTYHRMTAAIEDAGFEVRDCLMYLYGVGFPKSHNLQGEWKGWGTSLKPAFEPIILARKPLVGTVAENVLRHGTGGINIDASRVPSGDALVRPAVERHNNEVYGKGLGAGVQVEPAGRWPANVLHDGSDEVVGLFPQVSKSSDHIRHNTAAAHNNTPSMGKTHKDWATSGPADSGSAARFFKSCPYEEGDFSRLYYSAKASAKDRAGSKHPTVKPIALMRWLCTLITPPGGRILDPFAGSGTTLQAARECGFEAVGIEREEEYVADIRRRLTEMELTKSEPAKKDTVKPAPAMMDLFA